MLPATFDLAIVGGGIAGCALAREALCGGRSVVLCDGPRRTPHPYLGETTHRLEFGSGVSESFVCWSGRGIGVARNEPSHQIDKAALNRQLLSHAIAGGALYLPDTRVSTLAWQRGHWSIETNHSVIRAALVADATGRTACIARRLGATRVAMDRLTATTVALPPRGDLQQYLVEASEAGWWHCAHHPKLGGVATYFTDNDMRTPFAETLLKSKLARPFTGSLPSVRPRVLAAATAVLRPFAGPGWFAVGDAALSCDPLSSSGISNALRSAAWTFGGVAAYAERMGGLFAEYRREYRIQYESCAQRGEFWRRRTVGQENIL